MKSQACRNMEALVAMMNLVEAPKKLGFVPEEMPKIHREIEKDETQNQFEGAVFQAAKEPVLREICRDDEKAR